MKKHFLTLTTVLLLLAEGLLVCGCEKEPPPPPPVVDSELVPTLELSVTPEGVIPYGEGSVVINFQTKDANQVLVNGVRKPSVKLGTHTIKEKLFKDTTLVVKAINIKKMVEKSVTIQVGDWTTSTFGLVSYYPWKYKALSVSSFCFLKPQNQQPITQNFYSRPRITPHNTLKQKHHLPMKKHFLTPLTALLLLAGGLLVYGCEKDLL